MKVLSLFLFTFILPVSAYCQEIVSVNPSTSNAGQTLDVTITGANTTFSQGSSTYLTVSTYFGQGSNTITQNSVTVVNDTSIIYNLTFASNHPSGYVDMRMNSPAWEVFGLKDAMFINAPNSPQILSVNPSTANSGQTLDVTITGVNTTFSQGSSTHLNVLTYFGQGSNTITQNSVTVVNNTSIIYNLTFASNHPSGYVDMSMYTLTWEVFGLKDAMFINPITPPSLVEGIDHEPTELYIYPNPTTGTLTIEGAEGTVTVYDIYGRLALTTKTNTLDIPKAGVSTLFGSWMSRERCTPRR